MSVVIITGAAGLIGSMLRPRLARPGRTLRLLDIAPLAAGPGEEAIQASVTDLEAMTAACRGADAVIHLAGIPGEASWPRILETNINGGYGAFEAARRAGTPRVLADTPKTTRNPGRSAVRQASNSRPASSGDSQVDSIRTLAGRGKQDRMRRHIVSRPYRWWYIAASASVAALETP